jgi:hypothetical protein
VSEPRWYDWKEISLICGGKIERGFRVYRTDYNCRAYNQMMKRLRLFRALEFQPQRLRRRRTMRDVWTASELMQAKRRAIELVRTIGRE